MKQRKYAVLCLAVLLTLSLVLCGCGQSENVTEETTQPAQTETVFVEETVDVITEEETFDDGTTAQTVTTVEKLSASDRTTVQVTTNCIDGTVLVDTTVTETFRDGGTFQETRQEIFYPEGGSAMTLESQGTYADMTFRQVEEFTSISFDGSIYSKRTEVSVDEEGNTTVRTTFTQTDEAGNETKEETVTVTDAEGNVIG